MRPLLESCGPLGTAPAKPLETCAAMPLSAKWSGLRSRNSSVRNTSQLRTSAKVEKMPKDIRRTPTCRPSIRPRSSPQTLPAAWNCRTSASLMPKCCWHEPALQWHPARKSIFLSAASAATRPYGTGDPSGYDKLKAMVGPCTCIHSLSACLPSTVHSCVPLLWISFIICKYASRVTLSTCSRRRAAGAMLSKNATCDGKAAIAQ
mmetsp:Transcript_58771/g.108483  ORF Transcript_58771/g.108483 Transcript_58771/m.108483 type:complete len:205 (+) Transcript_58771:1056-1670(+)